MDKDEVAERILKGSEELFFLYGLKRVTVDDIAKHLGMSKKTIYLYFADKKEIIRTLIQNSMQNSCMECECIFKNAVDPIQEIIELMKYLSAFFTKVNPHLFYDMQKYYPDCWDDFLKFKEIYMLDMIEHNLKRGKEMGVYRSELDVKIIARLRLQQVDIPINQRIFPPDQFKLAEVHVALLDFFLHGITTIKGRKLIHLYNQTQEQE